MTTANRLELVRIIPLILILVFPGCASKPRVSTYVDSKTRTYTCVSPTLTLNQSSIQFSLFEQSSGNEKVVTQSCRKVSAAEQMVTEGGVLGAAAYAGLSVISLGVFNLHDAAGSFDDKFPEKCVTQKVEDSGKSVTSQVSANGRFIGKILVVPINFPEASKEQSFDGSIGKITLPVERSDSEYAVQVKGSYKSAKVQCDVDLQRVVKR